jgi:glucokinase
MSVLVMDLGGTRLKAGVSDGERMVSTRVVDVPPSGGRESLLSTIESIGRDLLREAPVRGVGLCVPGLVEDGTLVALPGKLGGLEGVDLSRFLRETFRAERTAVCNDAVAYAIGESVDGAGRGCRRTVVVTIGTGVGVTVVQDGAPATPGAFGGGILGGFIPIADGGSDTDSAGGTGTIEALCAARRIADGSGYATVPEVYEACARGEAAAVAAIERYRVHLARALVALAHAHAPDRLIVGGGPMHDGNPITPGIEVIVNERLYGSYRVEIRLSSLGDEAALVGLVHLLGTAR